MKSLSSITSGLAIVMGVLTFGAVSDPLDSTIAPGDTTAPADTAAPLSPADTMERGDDSLRHEPSGANAEEPADTGASAPADTAATAGNAVVSADSSRPVDSTTAVDTSARLWHRPFLGLGLGWTVGGMPVFDLWEKGLPAGLADVPRGRDSTVRSGFRVVEEPNPYSVTFPVTVSYSTPLREGRRMAVGATFARLRKSYRAAAAGDSLGTWWEREAWLALARITLEGTFHQTIAEQYFRIDNVDNASLLLGLGVTPLARLTMYSKEVNRSTEKSRTYKHGYNGIGASWTLGVSTLKQLSPGNGMEVGVVYRGHWFGYFRRDGRSLKRETFDAADGDGKERLSFLAHRFKIYFRVLIGRKTDREQTDDGE